MTEEIFNYLNKFCVLDEGTKHWLHEKARRIECKKKTRLLKPGDFCKHVWFIEKGLIRSYEISPAGKEICNWFMAENDIATAVNSFFRGVPSKEVVETVEDCVLWAVSREDLFAGFSKHPPLPILTFTMVVLYYCQSDTWGSGLRKKRPEDIYAHLLQHHPRLIERISEKHMASFLGVSEPTYLDIRLGSRTKGRKAPLKKTRQRKKRNS